MLRAFAVLELALQRRDGVENRLRKVFPGDMPIDLAKMVANIGVA